MRKMMEKVMKRRRRTKLREEQGNGQLRRTMRTTRTSTPRSRRRTIKEGNRLNVLPTPPRTLHPCPYGVHRGGGGTRSSSSRVQHPCTHTPNCKFCRNNQDFKALPSYKKYFKRRICLYFYLHFIFLYILLGGQPFLTVISGYQTVL